MTTVESSTQPAEAETPSKPLHPAVLPPSSGSRKNEPSTKPAASDISATLNQRATTHGDYYNTARVIQQLKAVKSQALNYRARKGLPYLTATQLESLDMILHKCGRILSGDPNEPDHWRDIEGYARLANKEEDNAG